MAYSCSYYSSCLQQFTSYRETGSKMPQRSTQQNPLLSFNVAMTAMTLHRHRVRVRLLSSPGTRDVAGYEARARASAASTSISSPSEAGGGDSNCSSAWRGLHSSTAWGFHGMDSNGKYMHYGHYCQYMPYTCIICVIVYMYCICTVSTVVGPTMWTRTE